MAEVWLFILEVMSGTVSPGSGPGREEKKVEFKITKQTHVSGAEIPEKMTLRFTLGKIITNTAPRRFSRKSLK